MQLRLLGFVFSDRSKRHYLEDLFRFGKHQPVSKLFPFVDTYDIVGRLNFSSMPNYISDQNILYACVGTSAQRETYFFVDRKARPPL